MNVMKLLGIALLCIASIAVLLGMVVPVVASLILGLDRSSKFLGTIWESSTSVFVSVDLPTN